MFSGYDEYRQKHIDVWMRTDATGPLISEGECVDSGRTMTLLRTYIDPTTGRERTVRSVTNAVDDNLYVFEVYDEDPAGDEFKTMEITYTRGDEAF